MRRNIENGITISYGNGDEKIVKTVKVNKNEELRRLRASVQALQSFLKVKDHQRRKNKQAWKCKRERMDRLCKKRHQNCTLSFVQHRD